MQELKEQWLILIATPVYLLIIGLELLLSHLQHRKIYSWKDTVANVYLLLLNSGLDLLFRIIYLAILQYFFTRAFLHISHPVVYWVLLVLFEDFMYYWLHRFDHEIRFFWATHVTHHSSQLMNFTVGFRSSVFQPLYRFLYFIPIAWLGFRPLDIIFVYAVTQIWGIFVHTELIRKMGWLEYILVTPSHHRVHHSSNPIYLDRNMGMFLIIWDKLFGTFQPELPEGKYQPIRYGLTKNIDRNGPLSLVFHEWVEIFRDVTQPGIHFSDRLRYLFAAPGWSHDGSRLTSQQLRDREKKTDSDCTVYPQMQESVLYQPESV
jgi:sterol desaturase/sphingolipid hydroxylase (fatty acid hydroxylase superfamily)